MIQRATGYRNIYDRTGKVNFEGIRGKSGVYIIRENGRIVYIGYSGSNLYKTMLRHFQVWNHSQQEVVSYAGSRKDYKARILFLPASQAAKFEKKLILKFRPRDNKNKYKEYSTEIRRKSPAPGRQHASIRKNVPF